MNRLEIINRQIRMQEKLGILIDQSTKLLIIVNENQKEVNRLREENEQLELQLANSTDQLANDGSVADQIEA
jgi:hypothetical protein